MLLIVHFNIFYLHSALLRSHTSFRRCIIYNYRWPSARRSHCNLIDYKFYIILKSIKYTCARRTTLIPIYLIYTHNTIQILFGQLPYFRLSNIKVWTKCSFELSRSTACTGLILHFSVSSKKSVRILLKMSHPTILPFSIRRVVEILCSFFVDGLTTHYHHTFLMCFVAANQGSRRSLPGDSVRSDFT